MTLYVVPIVEGKTEQRSVERLLQRVWSQLLQVPERLQVLKPIRGKRDTLIDDKKVDLKQTVEEAQIELRRRAARDPQARTLVLVLLDAEDDCPAELGPRLLETARKAWAGADVTCVIAKRMLESWMAAGATPATLGGVNGLPSDVQAPPDPEDHNGARWLGEQIRRSARHRKYAKTVDGPAFVVKMDLAQCRNLAPSFDKLCRELETRAQPPAAPPPPSPTSDG
jgi:hypothetical protein